MNLMAKDMNRKFIHDSGWLIHAFEFAAVTPYYYSTYEGGKATNGIDKIPEGKFKKKNGSSWIWTIRTGQGIEWITLHMLQEQYKILITKR